MITQTINLNLIPGGVLPRINVSQYDKGARTLQFNLYNGVTPFTIPDGSSVYVVGTKADKTGFDYEATYTGGLVSIDVTEQMTAFAGDVEIEIRIIRSGEQIATGNFILCVERTALADDTVISETDIPIIQHLSEYVAETEENAELAHKWATFGDESEEPSATNNAKYWAEQAEAVQDLTYDTVTGNPVSFTTDSSGISKDTIVTLEPIQSGSGDPSPTNVRPISGYNEIEVTNTDGTNTNLITSPLPSTIYGGTYDVETGELTVDRALVDLGTLNWTATITSISNKPRMSSTNIANEIKKPSSDNSPFNGNCSQYKIVSNNSTFYNTVGVGASASTGNLFIYDDRYTDATTFKTAMSGVQLAYELETPYTIQLEPHLLNLFEGQNNVSTNGTQISVTYRNGIVARVDDFNAVGESFEALTGKVEAVETSKAESSSLAPVESGATASKPYAVGDYLYRNGTLYRVTSAIASGATFTVNTNITATTVMAEIVRLTQ